MTATLTFDSAFASPVTGGEARARLERAIRDAREFVLRAFPCRLPSAFLVPRLLSIAAIEKMLEEHDICLISLRQNDEGAWKMAFEVLWKVAWRTAKRKLCYDSPEQIEDIVSQVVGREIVPQIVEPTQTAFVKAETFQDVVNITVRVVSNRVIDEIRRRTRLPEESSISKVSESEFINGSNEQKQEINDAIHSALESLDARYRDVLVLHYFDGLSTQEIAEKLDRPKGTICTDLVTARQMLESLLAGKRQKIYG